MSVEAMAWALAAPFGGTKKLVLIGLGNHASAEFDEARPAVDRLCEYACADRRTVQRALRWLEDEGWIEKTGAHPIAGRVDRAVNVYRLREERGGKMPLRTERGGAGAAERGGAGAALTVLQEPSIDPPTPLLADEDDRRAQGFLDWYREQLRSRRGGRAVPVNGDWLRAAREVVVGRTGTEITAVVLWGLDRGWWQRKINTLPKLAREYPNLRMDWDGEQRRAAERGNGSGHSAPGEFKLNDFQRGIVAG